MKLSFGFAKKAAAPKRAAVQVKDDGPRQDLILDVGKDGIVGQKDLEKPKAVVIPCKQFIVHQQRHDGGVSSTVEHPDAAAAAASSSRPAVDVSKISRGDEKAIKSGLFGGGGGVKKEAGANVSLADAAKKRKGGLISAPAAVKPEQNNDKSKVTVTDDEVVAALLRDAAAEPSKVGGAEVVAPILMQNKGFWDAQQAAKKCRNEKEAIKERQKDLPDTTRGQYERVRIEDFGKAMLLGMGWREEDDKNVKPVWFKRREEKLGLGASSAVPETLPGEAAKAKAKAKITPPKDISNEPSDPVVIEEIAEITITDSSSAPSEQPREDKVEKVEKSAKKRSRSPGRDGREKRARKEPSARQGWAQEGLLVRIVNEKRYKKYYTKKGVVRRTGEDGSVVKMIDSGEKLHDVACKDLETVVSKDAKSVLILKGEYQGRSAKLILKDGKKSRATVSIKGNEMRLNLEDVCEIY